MNRNKLLLEAVKHQQKKLDHIEGILREALAHPVFESLKQFENELEYQLFEAVVVGAGRAPASGKIAVGGGGSGREIVFGKHGKAIQKLIQTIDALPKVLDPSFGTKLTNLLDAAEVVVNIKQDREELAPDVDEQINIQLIRLENKLKNSLKDAVNAQNSLSGELKILKGEISQIKNKITDLNPIKNDISQYLDWLKGMKAPIDVKKAKIEAAKYEKDMADIDAYEEKLKKQKGGIFSRLARKVFG